MEIFGLIRTLFIVLAFTMTGEIKIRIFDGIGALFSVIYGITIRAFSTVLLNSILIAVHIYKLYRLRKSEKEEGGQG